MAKTIDSAKQGDKFLSSLLGNRVITPLDEEGDNRVKDNEIATDVKPVVTNEQSVSSAQSVIAQSDDNESEETQEETAIGRRGRKPNKESRKINISVSIDQNLNNNLKKIAFLNHLKVSNIVEKEIKKYVSYHSEDLEKFEKLPDDVKKLAGF